MKNDSFEMWFVYEGESYLLFREGPETYRLRFPSGSSAELGPYSEWTAAANRAIRTITALRAPAPDALSAKEAPEFVAAMAEIEAELARARAKFPGDNVTFAALVEEVGELAKAVFSEPRAAVRAEAVQVAVMALRLMLEGDYTFESWRRSKGLDPLRPNYVHEGDDP